MTEPIVIAVLPKNRREALRIALDHYRGTNLVDLRVVVEVSETSGLATPTRKGVAVRLEMLPDLIAALNKRYPGLAEESSLELGAKVIKGEIKW